MSERIVTPVQVEARQRALGAELDEATGAVAESESAYLGAKTDYEIAFARAIIRAEGPNAAIREAQATLITENELRALRATEATWRALKANVDRVRVQVDIARSVGTIVKSSMTV